MDDQTLIELANTVTALLKERDAAQAECDSFQPDYEKYYNYWNEKRAAVEACNAKVDAAFVELRAALEGR